MNAKKILFLFSLMVMISFCANPANAQDQEAMQKWMDYMTPGEPHKAMEKLAGDNWKYVNKLWMTPGQEPMVSEGTAKINMIMSGRYMQMNPTGSVMGMPFEGLGTYGYDNSTKKYAATWVDNFGTGIMTLEGTADVTGKIITYTGSMLDPMTGKSVQVREVITIYDDNKFVMEMYDTKDGVENRTMEMTATR